MEDRSMKFRKVTVFLAAAALGVSVLAGCGSNDTAEEATSEVVENTAESADSEEETVAEPQEEQKEAVTTSYLTGEEIDEEYVNYRPLALMMPNDNYGAIPHVGISAAGVIYEAPVEGSYTRLMAIFDRAALNNIEKLGPIRSCRLYYPEFALEYNAIYAHWGQAAYAEDFLKSGQVDDINGVWDSSPFYRDSNRKSPNNVFTNGELMTEAFQKHGFQEEYYQSYSGHFKFAESENTLENGQQALTVTPGYDVNKPYFEYNEEDGLYYRYQYGEKHMDAGNDTQLAVKNILIQAVPVKVLDEKGYLEIDTTAGGEGYYITDGKAIKVTWSKEDLYSRAAYYDENGNEIEINTGKTWVCVVNQDKLDKVTIE